ncbi:MAG: MgtC/SapB family protein [Ginsengibacter sp.]
MYSWEDIIFRLFLASVFGALIGLERERKEWTAGMRTHMMVSLGSALIMMVSSFGFSDVLGRANIVLDPSRIAAQVVSGIGFIGAGTILSMNKGRIHGLTTAAGLWTVAATGLATGCGMYLDAGAATLFALIILWPLQPLERKITQKFKQKTLSIETKANTNTKDILAQFEENQAHFVSLSIDKTGTGFFIQMKLENFELEQIKTVINKLQQNADINKIFWE